MSKFWRHFVSNGHASFVEGRLGLYGRKVALPERTVRRFELARTHGVKVRLLQPDGPAEQAGLWQGDILVMLAERPTTSLAGLRRLLARLPVGIPLPILVLREGRRLERWVILNDHPNPARRI